MGKSFLRGRKDRELLTKLVKAAEAQGWRVDVTGGGHIRFTAPDGDKIFSSFSPRTHRAVADLKSRLKRRGVVVYGDGQQVR